MSEHMAFLPKADILTLEELDRVVGAFVRMGTRKVRITGGEPLVRREVMTLFRALGYRVGHGLDELTLTTNGTLLARHAAELAKVGVRRVNVSMDTLDATSFAAITRWGNLHETLRGIYAARTEGLAVKINTVVLPGFNDHAIDTLVAWCGGQGFDLTLIETMPMGDLGEAGYARMSQYLPLSIMRARLRQRWTLVESTYRTGGPARYFEVLETGRRLGFITPMTHNFCESCNRVRLTCTGTLYMCLGQNDSADLRRVLRERAEDSTLDAAIVEAIGRKPKGHDFVIDRTRDQPAVLRHMSVTGG